MIGILLLSHGTMCRGVLDAMEVLGCETAQIEAVPLYVESELEEYTQQISQAVDRLDTGDGVLVITDLLAGTPFNRICTMFEEKNIEIISGMNLPMCITAQDFRGSETLQSLVQICKQEAKDAITSLNDLLKGSAD